MAPSLYSVLGVHRDADDAAIRSAYRRRALATHPDKGGLASEFLKVVHAFEVLADCVRRLEYNNTLIRTGSKDGLDKHSYVGASFNEDSVPVAAAKTAKAPAVVQEGSQPAEEKRAAKLWHEFLEQSTDECFKRIKNLSYRATEVLLSYAHSHACCGGAPVVASDIPSVGEDFTELAENPDEMGSDMESDTEGCGTALLAICIEPFGGNHVAMRDPDDKQLPPNEGIAELLQAPNHGKIDDNKKRIVTSDGRGRMVGAPPIKRARMGKRRRTRPDGCSRAWICLERLKICTGASRDVSEAVDWHISLVRIKQLYHEHMRKNPDFKSAMRFAVSSVLNDRAREGISDPRLRFVTEFTSSSGVLFTPSTWDLEAALRQHAELEKLRHANATREEVLDAIRRMTVASNAAAEDQKRLVESLEQHHRSFRRLLRRQGSRPEGVNAAFFGEDPDRVGFVYAELWQPSPQGNVLLCRGPRRRRADDAEADLGRIRAAQDTGGDAAAKLEAQRLYEQQMLQTSTAQ